MCPNVRDGREREGEVGKEGRKRNAIVTRRFRYVGNIYGVCGWG